MRYLILFPLFLLALTNSVYANVCTAQIQRTCKANQPCRPSETLTRLHNSANECLSFAKGLCTIHFTDGITSKQVRVHFDGQALAGGNNLCQ